MNFKTKSIKRDPKDNLPKLNEKAESLNRPITADKSEPVIKILMVHKSPESDSITGEILQSI